MYYKNRKRWDNDITTAQIEKFLIDNGFKKSQNNSPRWESYENDFFCDVDLDFDPFMHIDEDDDIICYDTPCYVYFDYVDFNETRCVSNLNELKDKLDYARKLYYGDDDDE